MRSRPPSTVPRRPFHPTRISLRKKEPPNTTAGRSTNVAFGILVVILNIAEIILITRLKRKKKIYEILLLSLSIADLLFGLSNAAVYIAHLTKDETKDVLEVTYTIYFFFVLTSICHLSFITVDRVWAIVRPIKHNIHITRKRVRKILAIIWSICVVLALSLYLSNRFTNTFKETTISFSNVTTNATIGNGNVTTTFSTVLNNRARSRPTRPSKTPRSSPTVPARKILIESFKENYGQAIEFSLAIVILIADTLFIVCYTFIIYTVQKKSKATQINDNTNTENKVSLVCVFIATTFVTFTIPYALGIIINGKPKLWGNLLLVANSGMNCIVYFFKGKCEKTQQKKQKHGMYANSSNTSTPMTTPLPIRHRITGATASPLSTPLSSRNDLSRV